MLILLKLKPKVMEELLKLMLKIFSDEPLYIVKKLFKMLSLLNVNLSHRYAFD